MENSFYYIFYPDPTKNHRRSPSQAKSEKPVLSPEPSQQPLTGKLHKPGTIYSSLQLQHLNQRFQHMQYLALPERAQLAVQLGWTHPNPGREIWFQYKCPQYKKLLKKNSGGQEEDFSGRHPSLSPCSPNLLSIWDLPKVGTLPTSGYDHGFGVWHQHHSPDMLFLPQMMMKLHWGHWINKVKGRLKVDWSPKRSAVMLAL
ncbi:homeobox protein DLX-4-like protein [Cricetulus griseus]|nr:homeobox protein DLX-4-like protein [Cricetulus griseus]